MIRYRTGNNLLGEIGFLYLAFALAYTIWPALVFILVGISTGDPLEAFSPDPLALAVHLWRHVLFIFSVAFGYLISRGCRAPGYINIIDSNLNSKKIINYLIAIILSSILIITIFSAPVQTYYDHYIRYDHLPWLLKKLISALLRVKLGLYTILLVYLFLNYKKNKFIIFISIILMSTYEITYSLGSRIESLIVILASLCLYNYNVKKVTLKISALYFLVILLLFSLVELVRSANLSQTTVQELIIGGGLKPASEFGAVFLTGFHLYEEASHGSLPPVEWPMFFNDLISLITFGDFVEWNPMNWYAKNYYPDSIVAPFTLGPIADSAIWGGEVDLFFRGFLNGIFFAVIIRWYIRYQTKWWGVTVYVYCYATCIMSLKYSIFYHFNPLIKTIIPAIIVLIFIKWLIKAFSYKKLTFIS